MLSLRTHSLLDYLAAAVLVLCPVLFGFSTLVPARNVFYFLGIGLAIYSMLTNYNYSIAKWIPVGLHMTLDVMLGLMIMIGPSIFNYREGLTSVQNIVHYIAGISAIALVLFTDRRSERIAVSTETGRRDLKRVA
jgi:hypothetical protein